MENNKTAFLITNFITLIRAVGVVAIVPVFMCLGGFATFLLSLGCFATDCIDGFMARKFKCSSFFGSMLDATSDKAFLIINMILLATITPLAVVPILFELSIATVQKIKFNNNVNIKASIFGKVKMCIAAVCILACYLLIDKNFLNYISADLAIKVASMDHFKLFSAVLLPMVLAQIVTLSTYIKEYFDYKKDEDNLTEEQEKVKVKEEKLTEEIEETKLSEFLFSNEFYEEYKQCNNLQLVRTLIKKKRK